MVGTYVARIIDVPHRGIKLEPTDQSALPPSETEVNLLAVGIAFGLGAAGYEHHPESRDPEAQTLDALLAGDAIMPWRPGERAVVPLDHRAYVVCEQSASGMARCHVRVVPQCGAPPAE